jgi:hypothetical protein
LGAHMRRRKLRFACQQHCANRYAAAGPRVADLAEGTR